MRSQRTALLCLTAALLLVAIDGAFAQKMFSRGPSPNIGASRPTGPVGPTRGGDFGGGGFRGPGWGAVLPGIIMAVPQSYPPKAFSSTTGLDDRSNRTAAVRAARHRQTNADSCRTKS